MDEFMAARYQMGVSLGFHIVFACIGMVMPWFMFVAEWKWLRTNNRVYLDLAKAWAKGVAIFFAVGAVSGTVLSFELGMLWPRFHETCRADFRAAIFVGRNSLSFWKQLPSGFFCMAGTA